MEQRWKWIVLAVLVLLVVLRLWSGRSVAPPAAPSGIVGGEQQAQTNTESAPVVEAKRVLVPDDPAKYGMVVVPPDQHPQTAQDWEKIMRTGIEKNHVLDTPEAKRSLEQAKVSPEEFEKNMEHLDAGIARYEARLQEDPFDDELKQHLKVLYQVKAAANIMKDKVVR